MESLRAIGVVFIFQHFTLYNIPLLCHNHRHSVCVVLDSDCVILFELSHTSAMC